MIGQPEDRFDDPGDAGKPDEDLDLRSHSCDVKGLDPKGLACGMPLGGVNVNILYILPTHMLTHALKVLTFLLSYVLTSSLLTYLPMYLLIYMRAYLFSVLLTLLT